MNENTRVHDTLTHNKDNDNTQQNDDNITNEYLNNIYFSKRKNAICRLCVSISNTQVIVNNKPMNEYFDNVHHWISRITEPINIFDISNIGFKCNVRGGGKMAQSDSVRYAIGKFLRHHLKYEYRSDNACLREKMKILKQHKLLTVDARIVECKKYGLKKARKRRQRSKR